MKNIVFSLLWATICSLVLIKLGAFVSAEYLNFEIADTWRKVMFFGLIVIFMVTGLHKSIGTLIKWILGIALFLIIAYLVISLAYLFFTWIVQFV